MALVQQFEEAAENVKTLTKRPTDEELLELYSIYKQATIGDCNTKKPGMMDGLKAKKKWEFWNNKKGTSKENAQQMYIEFVKKLLNKYQ